MSEKRKTSKIPISTDNKIINTCLICLFGIGLGVGSKALDETAFNDLPAIFQKLDITNFLGRFAVWIFIAVCISVYSSNAKRAAVNVFAFFAGMVSGYYIYSAVFAGFFPKQYALIWFGITAVSPVLAYICWFANGDGMIPVLISGVIIGVLFAQAVLLLQGIRIAYIPELIVWLASLWVLRRKIKEFLIMIGISVAVSVVCQMIFPYLGIE